MTRLLRALVRFVSKSAQRPHRQAERPSIGERSPATKTYYRHRCVNGEDKVVRGVRVCRICGQTGKFAGWDYSVAEHWGRCRCQTGLKPFGPHKRAASELIWTVLQHCTLCDGVGYCERADQTIQPCTACDGRGTIPALTDWRVQEVLRLVEERYPGACAPGVIQSAHRR